MVTGDITVNSRNDTHVTFKNCAPFSTCKTKIDDVFIDEANHIYIAMPMYNLIEYSGNYSDTLGGLSQFKRDKVPDNNAYLGVDNNVIFNSQSFKYKTALARKAEDENNVNSFVKNTKIVVPLKYKINFLRSLEIALISCKIHLESNCTEDCILSSAGDSAKIKITDAKFNAPVITLSTKDNVHFTKQLNNGFKSSVYWDNYQSIPAKVIHKGNDIYIKIVFVLVYVIAANAANNKLDTQNNRKYFLLRAQIEKYNVLIDGGNFYDHPIDDLIKQYDEVKKLSTGPGDDYTTGCLLDYAYFKDTYTLIRVDLINKIL